MISSLLKVNNAITFFLYQIPSGEYTFRGQIDGKSVRNSQYRLTRDKDYNYVNRKLIKDQKLWRILQETITINKLYYIEEVTY